MLYTFCFFIAFGYLLNQLDKAVFYSYQKTTPQPRC